MSEHALAAGTTFPWHEVYTADLNGTTEFYTKALGFGTEQMQMGEMGSYTMLTMNGKGVAGMMDTNTLDMPNVPPHWSVYLAVDNVDERLKMVTSMGGKIIVEAMDVPTVGRMSLIQDPQGAMIWLYQESA